MPQTKFEDVVFTIVMASLMVYGMVVYNVALNTQSFGLHTFAMAIHELPIMVPIAFVIEFFAVGKIAKIMGFAIIQRTGGKMQYIVYAISGSICLIMCPTMSFIATILFKELTFMTWFTTFLMNLPMAFAWQLIVCGPVVRGLFRAVFRRNDARGAMA